MQAISKDVLDARAARLDGGSAIRVETSTDVLSVEALGFVERLHRELNPERERLLAARDARRGEQPSFVRAPEEFTVAPAPADLQDRRVEITGPVERKMMINALNSGAKVFMADFEDANSPTWENVQDGQRNVHDAVRRTIALDTGEKSYRLNDETATLVIRPRGWHLIERHHLVDGAPISASLFDFGLVVFNNAREQLERGTGPYFYLPKLESHDRGAALGAGVRARRAGARTAARLDQVHRPDRDDLRRVRDGRDPLRAARPLVRAERGPVGLHLQLHQEDGRAAARPRAGDDDRAVHARLHGAARQDVPPPWSARDRRHGGIHSLAARSGGERDRAREGRRGQAARGGRRLRRHVGRPSGSRAGRAGRVRRGARRPAEPARPQARRRRGRRRSSCSTSRSRAARSPTRACA